MLKRHDKQPRLIKSKIGALEEISKVALSLYKKKVDNIANDIAKIAIDLTNGDTLIKVSPIGISIGDRVKSTIIIKRKNTIPKATPGNIVGFDPKSRRYLVLFFPVWFPQGVLVLVGEKEINFLMKPKFEEPMESVFTDPEKSFSAPRSAIVRAFFDEILANNGLEVSGEWMTPPGSKGTYCLRAVIKRQGVKVPRGNREAAQSEVRSIVSTLQQEVVPSVKSSGVESFVEITESSAWEAPLRDHRDLLSYAALEVSWTL